MNEKINKWLADGLGLGREAWWVGWVGWVGVQREREEREREERGEKRIGKRYERGKSVS